MCQELINHFWNDSTLNHLLTKRWTLKSFPFHLSQATYPPCRPQEVSLMSPGAIVLGQFGPVAPSVPAPPRYPVPCFGGVLGLRSEEVGMYFPTHSNIMWFQWQLTLKGISTNKNAVYKSQLVLLERMWSDFRCSASVKTLFGQNALYCSCPTLAHPSRWEIALQVSFERGLLVLSFYSFVSIGFVVRWLQTGISATNLHCWWQCSKTGNPCISIPRTNISH